jgi:hypothetical protein
MIGSAWTMDVETGEKETPLDEIDTSYDYSRHDNQLENLVSKMFYRNGHG